jgi:hypothetical protein
MKLLAMRLTAVIAMLFLLPLAALAADEPEAVYAKYHRATMAGDLDEMLKHGPAKRRAEIQGMSASSREAALKMAQYLMPRAFTLQRKTVQSNGRATLIVSGPWEGGRQRLETMYGIVRMVTENGEWKVDETAWSSEKPAILAAPKPAAPAAAADKAAPRGGTGKGAPVVGSMESASPARTLGDAKPPCVYKPVMTAVDMENCK